MNINPSYKELDYNVSTIDGDYDARLYKYYVKEAEKTYEIPHGLGRSPRKIDIVYSDSPLLFECNSFDAERVVLTFFENQVTIVLRFE